MAGHDMFLREGTIDVPTLRRAATRVPVTLLEIRADVPPHEASAPAAPGALPVYWKDLLWQPDSRDFADVNLLRDRLARLGSAPGGLIVVYGEHRQYGFYARWALRHAGLPRVFVLERPDLLEQALPVSPATTGRLIVEPAPLPRRALRQDVLSGLSDPAIQIVDARTREEYDGYRVGPSPASNHGAERAGHIPGAVNLHYLDLLDNAGALQPDDVLQAVVARTGLDRKRPVIAYCRLSHRASLVTFVLQERLGYTDVRLYDGSWTEWGSSVGTPIAHGRPVTHPRP